MKAIVGLGNPEVKYLKTRHNIGFMVIDEILKRKKLTLSEKFKGFFAKENDILFLMPKTYMNLSGESVIELANFYKLNPEDILVIMDDTSLPLGTLRYRPSGSSGGHNGLKSITKHLSSENFPRLKVGVGPIPANFPIEAFVLGNFTKDEEKALQKIVPISADAALDWMDIPAEKLQSKYNKAH